MRYIFLISGLIIQLFSNDHFISWDQKKYRNRIISIAINYPGLMKEIDQVIEEECSNFKREFSFLVIGDEHSYHPMNIKSKFNPTIILMKNAEKRFSYDHPFDEYDVVLNFPFTMENFRRLSEVEFFDVVLLLDPLVTLGEDWDQKLESIAKLAFKVLIFIPPSQKDLVFNNDLNIEKLNKFFHKKYNINQLTSQMKPYFSKFYFLSNRSKKLLRSNFVNNISNLIDYEIVLDYEVSRFKKVYLEISQTQVTEFIPGINLLTYLMLGGQKPSRAHIKQMISQMVFYPHSDFMPYNMILSKKGLSLIDFDDWRCEPNKKYLDKIYCDEKKLKNIFQVIDSHNFEFIKERTLKGFK